MAEGETRAETEPQALMQTPCRTFLQGVAKFALHEKARSAPASVGSTKNGTMQSTLYGGGRDASGNRAADVNANTLQGFPAGCCEIRLAARWWSGSNLKRTLIISATAYKPHNHFNIVLKWKIVPLIFFFY